MISIHTLAGRRLPWVVIAFSIAFVVGCTIADKTSYQDEQGVLPESFFSDIRNGKTTQQWIEAQLGVPESVQQGPGSQQIYNYRFSRVQKKHADLLVVLRYDGVAHKQAFFHLLFEDGVVKKHWHDDYLQVQEDRYFARLDKAVRRDSDRVATPRAGEELQAGNELQEGDEQQTGSESSFMMQSPPPADAAAQPYPHTPTPTIEPIDRDALPPEAKKKAPPYPKMVSPAELWPDSGIQL